MHQNFSKESFCDIDRNDISDVKLKEFFQIKEKESEKHRKKKENEPMNFPLKKTSREYGSDINSQLTSLSKALFDGDYEKTLSIINFLMKRNDVEIEDRRLLFIQFLDMLCNKNAFDLAQENHFKYKHIFEYNEEEDEECDLRIFEIVYELYKIKIDLHLSDLYLSYFFYLRKTQKWKKEITNFKKNEDQIKKKYDYTDSLADEIQKIQGQVSYDFIINLQLTENSAGSLNLLHGWGDNSQFATMGIGTYKSNGPTFIKHPIAQPVFRNRIILSVSCGDYHTIALVSGTKNYDYYRALKKEEKDQYSIKDVFVWGRNSSGQCDGSPDLIKYYNSPVVIAELIDKDIQNVYAYKNYTMCYDKENNVYEWGANIMDETKIEPKFKIETGIIDMGIGNGFKCALDSKGDVYAWGNLKSIKDDIILNSVEPKKINGNDQDEKMVKISVGYDHMICINKKKFLYFWGCNDSGQGAFSEREKSASKIKISKYIGGEKILNCWACEKLSIVQTCDNELYYFGLYSYDPKKIAWYPRDFCLEDEALPLQITHCGTNLYLCSTNGKIYNWDLKLSHRFKQERYKGDDNYAEVKSGRGWLMLRKPYIVPSRSSIKISPVNVDTDSQVTLKLSYKDTYLKDLLKFNIDYNLRIGICVSEEKLEKSAVEKLSFKMYSDADIKEIDQTSIKGISVLKLRNNEVSIKDISIDENSIIKFKIPKDGSFHQYVTINEELIEECISKPKIITVIKSKKLSDKQEVVKRKQEFENKMSKIKQEESIIIQEVKMIDDYAKKERQNIILSNKKSSAVDLLLNKDDNIFKSGNMRRSSLMNLKEKSLSRCGSIIKEKSLSRCGSIIINQKISRDGSIIKVSNSRNGSIIKTQPDEINTTNSKNILNSSSKLSGRKNFLQSSGDINNMKNSGLGSRLKLKKNSNLEKINQALLPNISQPESSLAFVSKNQDVPLLVSKFSGGEIMKRTEETWYNKTNNNFSTYNSFKSEIMNFCDEKGTDIHSELNQTMQTVNMTIQKNSKLKKFESFENKQTPNRKNTYDKATFSALKPSIHSFDQDKINKTYDDTSDIEEQDIGDSLVMNSSLHKRGTSFKITSSARNKTIFDKDIHKRSASNVSKDSVRSNDYNNNGVKPIDLYNRKFNNLYNTASKSQNHKKLQLESAYKDVRGEFNIMDGSGNKKNTSIFKNINKRNASISKDNKYLQSDNKLNIDKDEIDITQRPVQANKKLYNNKTMGPSLMQEIKSKRPIGPGYSKKS